MALINCCECGQSVSDKGHTCPKCGCPVEDSLNVFKEKRKLSYKKIGIELGIFCLVLGFIILLNSITGMKNKYGYYEKTKWGMSCEEVKAISGENYILSKDGHTGYDNIDDYDGMKGVDAFIIYEFRGKKLYQVYVNLSNGSESSYSDASILEKYEKIFDDLYDKTNKDDLEGYWETKKSVVEINKIVNGYISIEYQDINEVDR